MRILVACEESGVLTKELRLRGHDAWSCDLLPTSGEYPEYHIQDDAVKVLESGNWGALFGFPPCNHICASGARYFAEKRKDGRQQAAIKFFMRLATCDLPFVAIENSVGIMSKAFRKPDQIIQPYEYGHDASKKTCLWLKGFCKLTSTKYIDPRLICCGKTITDKYGCPNCNGDNKPKPRWGNQTDSGQNKLSPSKERATRRAKTYQGIAAAMAEQWHEYLTV